MVVTLERADWHDRMEQAEASGATAALEAGAVLQLPALAFEVTSGEQRLFSIGLSQAAKNVSFTPATGRLGGCDAAADDRHLLASVLARFSTSAAALARAVFPAYAPTLEIARTSFRPAEIAGRRSSWRKDDTRIHVDSFPSSPTGGKRILRVFSNVNPSGRPRTWRVGGAFEEVASRYRPQLRMPWSLQTLLLRAAGITKTRRTPYDALMLQLHDLMKRDDRFQRAPTHCTVEFASGTTWMAFTDQVGHAAMAGQYQFEQTILVPIRAMENPDRSPLKVLERLMGRTLV